jgi:Tfp pilus assembly protein PilN
MIKVNLLGVPAPKPKAKAAAPAKKAVQVATFLGALAVSFAIVGLTYLIWSGSVTTLRIELKKQQAEQTRLAAIKQENMRYQRDRALLELRVKAIEALQSSRVGPKEFMNALGNVVNKTPSDLYFFSVAHQGDRVDIQGQAGSANSVAALMASLKSSGYFDDVELKQFYEDDKENLVSYKFNMDCLYKPPSGESSLTPAGARSTPTRSQRVGM